MSRQVSELEEILIELIAEHQRLLKQLHAQQIAMSKKDLGEMEVLAKSQEASRRRVMSLEARRRNVIVQVSRAHNFRGEMKIQDVAGFYPQRSDVLMKHREMLKDLIEQVSNRAKIAGRLAGAIVGHLNTMVRLVAGAVEKAGLYTKDGVPSVSARVGVMEAMG